MGILKSMIVVVLSIAVVTTIALWWGRASAHPLPKYTPDPMAKKDMPPVKLGSILYEEKGCVTCHTIDGTPRVGPTFLHDFGSEITLDNGATITVDDAYLRESIESPRAKARPGYPPAMPAEYGTLLTKREKNGLVAFIESLR